MKINRLNFILGILCISISMTGTGNPILALALGLMNLSIFVLTEAME